RLVERRVEGRLDAMDEGAGDERDTKPERETDGVDRVRVAENGLGMEPLGMETGPVQLPVVDDLDGQIGEKGIDGGADEIELEGARRSVHPRVDRVGDNAPRIESRRGYPISAQHRITAAGGDHPVECDRLPPTAATRAVRSLPNFSHQRSSIRRMTGEQPPREARARRRSPGVRRTGAIDLPRPC